MGVFQSFLFTALTIGVASRFLDDVSSSDVNAVRIRLTEEKSKRLLLKNDVETLMLKVEELERKLNDGPSETPAGVPAPSNVFFNAKLTMGVTLDALHIVVFDQVLENVGGGYSASTGIFRAPVSGTYLFSLTILSKGKAQYAHIQLMKNDTELGRAFAGSEVANWAQTGAIAIAEHLTEGDEVYTREFPGLTGHLLGENYCSFSGILLNAD